MRWIIKNPAPSDGRREKWGDFHFGRSLSKCLTRAGHEVVTHYDPGWDEDGQADVVLVLRGKYPFEPGRAHEGALRVMWNISHPADVPLDEYATYDLVAVASRPWAEKLNHLVPVPVVALLQCTDTEEFYERDREGERRGFVFVGNTRGMERPAVLWAVELGLPLEVWGRGWGRFKISAHVAGDYIRNEELGQLYSRARVTLNDHWADMKEYGFINNRVFDAIACGLPVISDHHEELEALLPDVVLTYRDKGEFRRCVENILLAYPGSRQRVRDAMEYVRMEHSFERRTQRLIALVETRLGGEHPVEVAVRPMEGRDRSSRSSPTSSPEGGGSSPIVAAPSPQKLTAQQLSDRRHEVFRAMLSMMAPGRCVDLGTGHGSFAREAASLGWTVTAVDARTERWPEDERVTWVQADVRDVDLAPFDLVLCLGLFYHLPLADQLDLLGRAAGRPLILDTHVDHGQHVHELSDRVTVDGYEGRLYHEPGKTTSSWGNDESFWPTLPSFHAMLSSRGFTTVLAANPWTLPDRTFFLALPEQPAP